MKSFKKVMLAAACGAAFLGSAQAAQESNTFLLANVYENTVGTLAQYYPVTNQAAGVSPRVDGDTFVDDYVLQLIEGDTFSVALQADAGSVSFESISMLDFTGGTYDFAASTFTSKSFLGTGLPLISGLYDLQVTGEIEADGGSYSGAIYNAAAVPEPQEWALMLVGLAALGGYGRRRASGRR
ncbi:MAG: FxDxF family PEP-CTERM protein [Pseudomonadota bacterium]|nr:FxDxF family PEP-CTERM protein [Pseudomonadota bacterium]